MLQHIAPQDRASGYLLADGANHVEERPVDSHDQLLAPDDAAVVRGDPDPGDSVGLHVQLGMRVICQTSSNLKDKIYCPEKANW